MNNITNLHFQNQYVKLRRENVQICDEKKTKVHLEGLKVDLVFLNYVVAKCANVQMRRCADEKNAENCKFPNAFNDGLIFVQTPD